MGAARDAEQQPGPPGEEGPGGAEEQLVSTSPWNIMIKHRQVQRRGRRSQMTTSFTDPAVSMDLLRAVLQPSINEEIRGVFNKYMKFFQKAAINVRDNVGEEVDPEQLIQETCRSCLEQAKLLFSDGKKVVPRLPHEQAVPKRARQMDEELNRRGSPVPKKRKGRPPGQSLSNDRGVSGMAAWKLKVSEPVRRDGPKWDPSRLTETTTFVLGSRANKALGMGGTRGRLYIKHPHLFKYAADPQDKHWLAEQQHMRATGGKMAYLLIEEDIGIWLPVDDYRDSVDLRLEELKPFVPPAWMTEKMQKHMETLRRGVDAPPPEGPPNPEEPPPGAPPGPPRAPNKAASHPPPPPPGEGGGGGGGGAVWSFKGRPGPAAPPRGAAANRDVSAEAPGGQSRGRRQLPRQPHPRRAAIGRLERGCALIGGGAGRWKHSNGARERGGGSRQDPGRAGPDRAAAPESPAGEPPLGTERALPQRGPGPVPSAARCGAAREREPRPAP
ncbi:deoxynucleotidyltransferase terminal-interacting protein 1 [Aptenodytes patagonicus]|uniref:deoxynucleotidyltransferase terminal-interacting protein 1 n=1 Tax=Aptenodytes patagonicus TaxID=9234 RepID=UPI003FA0DA7C